jgi:hypothetical protein
VIVRGPAEIVVEPASKPPAPPPPAPRLSFQKFVPPAPPPPTNKYSSSVTPESGVHKQIPTVEKVIVVKPPDETVEAGEHVWIV